MLQLSHHSRLQRCKYVLKILENDTYSDNFQTATTNWPRNSGKYLCKRKTILKSTESSTCYLKRLFLNKVKKNKYVIIVDYIMLRTTVLNIFRLIVGM